MSIFDGLIKTEAQATYESMASKLPKIKQGTIARVSGLHTELYGTEDNPKTIEQAQAVLDMFGTDAAELFIWSGGMQQVFMKDPSYVPFVPPYGYTINEDGTVTLEVK